jgi:hypothetical protein
MNAPHNWKMKEWRCFLNSIAQFTKGGTKTFALLSIAEGLSFGSLDRRIYDCKLPTEKKRFNLVRKEFSPPTSKLVA